MEFFGILFLAVIVEGVSWWGQEIIKTRKIPWNYLVDIVFGVALCIGTHTDLFAMVGVPVEWPYVGQVLTGLLVSRGSDYLKALTSKLTSKIAGNTEKSGTDAAVSVQENKSK